MCETAMAVLIGLVIANLCKRDFSISLRHRVWNMRYGGTELIETIVNIFPNNALSLCGKRKYAAGYRDCAVLVYAIAVGEKEGRLRNL